MTSKSTNLENAQSVPVKWDDLHDAFFFVNSAQNGENQARLNLSSGKIRYHSIWNDTWDVSEDDDSEEEDADGKILNIPHKTDLGLGRDLVLLFVEEIIPDQYEDVAHIFHKRGAYATFKALLAEQGLLEQWYQFENDAEEQALRRWCEESGISIVG